VCGIYPVRPLQCRTWPFWDGNLASAENWNAAAKRCPGMNRGRRFGKAEIEALRDATDWPDRPPTSKGGRRKPPPGPSRGG
jgi:Fe-S-cluster containining protein